jgi:secreted Zn-dependent insulinase-like peptidase
MKNRTILLILFLLFTTTTEGSVLKVPLSEITKQKTKHLVLNNKLKVYIISNPNTEISSASLSMVLGQGDTPADYIGLPHVLEHSLLLGTKSYPKMTDWSSFFKPKGWSNGSTRTDISRYHFQVGSNYFGEGLIRLHDLLFNPLLTESAVIKALKDVESEYHSKNNDWRKLLSVMRESINPRHPLAIFGTGNTVSLGPYSKAMHKELIKLYNQFYHPENMVLVVYHSSSLEELERQVKLIFEETPSKFKYKRSVPPSLLLESQVGNIIKVNTDKSNYSLDIRFEIPPRTNNVNFILPEYLGTYLSEVISKNSDANGLITNVSIAFQGDLYTGLVDIYVKLAPEGNEKPEEVINLIFDALTKFKQDIQNPYVKQKHCSVLQADYDIKVQEVGDWLSDISDQMVRRKSNTYSMIEYCPSEIPLDKIEYFNRFLSRENTQIFHVTDKKINTSAVTKFYNVPFSTQKLGLKSN